MTIHTWSQVWILHSCMAVHDGANALFCCEARRSGRRCADDGCNVRCYVHSILMGREKSQKRNEKSKEQKRVMEKRLRDFGNVRLLLITLLFSYVDLPICY